MARWQSPRQEPLRRESAGRESAGRREGIEPASIDRELSLPAETVFELLRNGRRRATIEFLAKGNGTRSMAAVSKAVAAAEHDLAPEHVTERQRRCVYVSLRQVHLPTLVEAGVIEWDERAGRIRGSGQIPALAAAIDLVEAICETTATA